ncbi:hypothetical protein [Spirosoma sp. KUDC1026]|uniref:hypothetical protein n=1 Tax=Spirosoma sp. KUDC1026 TaxID=2745947 RepID=UPI00159BE8DF|nr:hypothetical protein [Spirosoma sp. KUDC1026]QKZ15463.1 hypothetical protein HU175_23725 [Spirosoma sp. KUDC1026]
MEKLSRDQLNQVSHHIQQTNPHQALQTELIDHLATIIEQRMDQGSDFQTAFDQAKQQASPQALSHLEQLYAREFMSRFLVPATGRAGVKSRHRLAAKPLRNMLLSSVITLLLLMGVLVGISRPLAIPLGAFQPVWGAALLGLSGVTLFRWWLTRRLRKPKRMQTT